MLPAAEIQTKIIPSISKGLEEQDVYMRPKSSLIYLPLKFGLKRNLKQMWRGKASEKF